MKKWPHLIESAHQQARSPRTDPRSSTDDPRSTSHENESRGAKRDDEHEHELELEHEHEHDDGREGDARDGHREIGQFPHEKLDAYRVALEMAVLAKELSAEIPRGHRNIADHLERAADNTVLLMAEGANRRGPALKRQRFVESRGEAGEVAAAADLILVLVLGSRAKAKQLKNLSGRVCMMLTRLIAKFE